MLSYSKLIIFIKACEFQFLQANDDWIQVRLDTIGEKGLHAFVGSKKASQECNYVEKASCQDIDF